MSKHRRTINYKDFIKMFPDKYSCRYNVECIRTHKHRCDVLHNKNERLKYIESL